MTAGGGDPAGSPGSPDAHGAPDVPDFHGGSATRKAYVGEQSIVSFDSALCQHAAECVRGAPTVFDTSARPWITPDGAPADELEAVVGRCPSGALRFSRVA